MTLELLKFNIMEHCIWIKDVTKYGEIKLLEWSVYEKDPLFQLYYTQTQSIQEAECLYLQTIKQIHETKSSKNIFTKLFKK